MGLWDVESRGGCEVEVVPKSTSKLTSEPMFKIHQNNEVCTVPRTS
jgi:hypothetical protein